MPWITQQSAHGKTGNLRFLVGLGAKPQRPYSFAIASSRRFIVSSLPSRYAISNAPPGVAARPVMAMRSGQSTVAFFMPDSGMAAITVSCRLTSVQSAIPSRIGRTKFERGLAGFRRGLAFFVGEQRHIQFRHLGEEIHHARKLAENLRARLQQLAETVEVKLLRVEHLREPRLGQLGIGFRGHAADILGVEPRQLVGVEDRRALVDAVLIENAD